MGSSPICSLPAFHSPKCPFGIPFPVPCPVSSPLPPSRRGSRCPNPAKPPARLGGWGSSTGSEPLSPHLQAREKSAPSPRETRHQSLSSPNLRGEKREEIRTRVSPNKWRLMPAGKRKWLEVMFIQEKSWKLGKDWKNPINPGVCRSGADVSQKIWG